MNRLMAMEVEARPDQRPGFSFLGIRVAGGKCKGKIASAPPDFEYADGPETLAAINRRQMTIYFRVQVEIEKARPARAATARTTRLETNGSLDVIR